MSDSDPVRRLCAAVTPHRRQNTSEPDPGGHGYERMLAEVRRACALAGLDRALTQELPPPPGRESTGRGVLLLATPSGTNEARTITNLVRGLERAVTEAAMSRAERLRVVIAFDQGITRVSEAGFEGRVVTAVHRLCTAVRAHAWLSADEGAAVGVVISAALLDDLLTPPESADDHAEAAGLAPLSVEFPGRRIAAWSHTSGRPFRLPGQG